jgi:hypothetical protein
MNSASGVWHRGNETDVPVLLTRAQLETAIRLATTSKASSLMKKLIMARSQADLRSSRARAVRLKNWQ